MKKLQKGFTLIELLIVIAIIGILASISLVSLNSARNRANKASAQASLSSVMPELVTCADDVGIGTGEAGDTTVPTTALFICGTDATGVTAKTGHSAKWPPLSSGWSYQDPTGTLAASTYSYTATDGTSTITCTVADNKCQ